MEAARDLGRASGLTNLTVHDRPDLPTDLGGGPIDLVVVDGVVDAAPDHSWYGLTEALAASLRPGGLVCVAYRTTVGWSEVRPLHRLVRHLVARDPRPRPEATEEARRVLRELEAGSAGFIAERPVVAAWLTEALALSPADFAAVVADLDLQPVSHAYVAERLERVACRYVGPTHPDDLAGPALSKDLAAVVDSAPSPAATEALTDLTLGRTHRRDLFRLGEGPIEAQQRQAQIGALEITGRPGLDPDDPKLRSITRVATVRALASGSVTVADLAADPDGAEAVLRRLLATGLVWPVRAGGAPSVDDEALARLNAVTALAPTPATQRVLVAPLVANAVSARRRLTKDQRIALGAR